MLCGSDIPPFQQQFLSKTAPRSQSCAATNQTLHNRQLSPWAEGYRAVSLLKQIVSLSHSLTFTICKKQHASTCHTMHCPYYNKLHKL